MSRFVLFFPRCGQVTFDAYCVFGEFNDEKDCLKGRSFWEISFKIENSSSRVFNFSSVVFLW